MSNILQLVSPLGEQYLIFLAAVAIFVLGALVGMLFVGDRIRDWIPQMKKDSLRAQRNVLGGKFTEQLAPYLPDFPFDPTEAKFLGSPVDLIVFKGMSEKNINEVIFVEIKSGKSRLSPGEWNLKRAIQNKQVRWEEYRVPVGVTTPLPVIPNK